MTLAALKEQIAELRVLVGKYGEILRTYDDLLFDDQGSEANKRREDNARSQLMRKYAQLDVYIQNIGMNHRTNKGASVYPFAFSSADLPQRRSAVDAVLQDLDYISGKLENVGEAAFGKIAQEIHAATRHVQSKAQSRLGTSNNPHKQYWGMLLGGAWKWVREHILATVVAGLILAGLVYLLGWN